MRLPIYFEARLDRMYFKIVSSTHQGMFLVFWEAYQKKKQPSNRFNFLKFGSSVWVLQSSQFSSVQSLSCIWLFATPWTAAHQASLSINNSRSLPKLMSIESVMPSNYLILCRPLLLLPSIFPSIRVFSSESALRMRWPKYWSFSFNISPSNEHPGLISL